MWIEFFRIVVVVGGLVWMLLLGPSLLPQRRHLRPLVVFVLDIGVCVCMCVCNAHTLPFNMSVLCSNAITVADG